MNTINKKTQLYKYAVAAVLIVILAAAQITTAEELWKRSGTTLEPNESSHQIGGVTDFNCDPGTATAGKFRTTGCTASGTKAVAFGNNSTVSGNNAAAFGDATTASGAKAAAFGKNSTASGESSAAFGLGTKARGNASFAAGYCSGDANTIDANGTGSLAAGYASGTTGPGKIRAWNDGSIALGYAVNDSNIYSSGKGSIAMGDANGGAEILATADGAFVVGYCHDGFLQSSEQGSIVMGYVSDSNIYSQGKGSIAMGNAATGRTIQSSGTGSIAMGYAYDGDTKATHDGAVAIGDGVVADACDAFAIGKSFTNSTADSFAVGFGQKDLEVWDANAKVNGDMEVTTLKENETKTMFFPSDYGDYVGDYRTKPITTSGEYRFNFRTPSNYVSLVSLKLVGIVSSGAAGDGKNIDIQSDYAAIGEPPTTHSESDSTSTYNGLTANQWYGLDISGLFDSLAAGDNGGIYVKHNAIGGDIDYIGVILKYKNE